MSPPEPSDFLSRTLAAWRVAPLRNPQFRAAVWSRLEHVRGEKSWAQFARSHAGVLGGALAFALVVGGWIGREQARDRLAADRTEIARAYVQEMDPRMMRLP